MWHWPRITYSICISLNGYPSKYWTDSSLFIFSDLAGNGALWLKNELGIISLSSDDIKIEYPLEAIKRILVRNERFQDPDWVSPASDDIQI